MYCVLGQIGTIAHDSADSLTGFLTSDSELLQTASLESLRRIGVASPEAQTKIRRLCSSESPLLAISAFAALTRLPVLMRNLCRIRSLRLVKALEILATRS